MIIRWNYVCILLSCLINCVLAQDSVSGRSECQSRQHAYTTLMKYPDGLEVDEGPYCDCADQPQPPSKWNVDDGHTLTWQHYERAHWTVQYRFCTPKFNDKLKECEGDERAAVMQTETSGWHINLAQARCRCPKGKLFQLQGWKREGDQWRYYYNCLKNVCRERNSTCARITVREERSDNTYGVQEMEIFCACGEGHMCPAKLQDLDKENLKEKPVDFLEKRCESIRQTGKEKSR